MKMDCALIWIRILSVFQVVFTEGRSAGWWFTMNKASLSWLRPAWVMGRTGRREKLPLPPGPECSSPTPTRNSRCPRMTESACSSWTLEGRRGRLWVFFFFFPHIFDVPWQKNYMSCYSLIQLWQGTNFVHFLSSVSITHWKQDSAESEKFTSKHLT